MPDHPDRNHDLQHRRPDHAGDGITISELHDDHGVREAREHFGGLDIPATLAGMLAALGATVLLAGLLGGAGTVGFQAGAVDETSTGGLSLLGFGAGLVTLVVAFLLGGWVAGRMARYDGGRNGVMTAVWFLALTAVLGGLGAWAGDRFDLLSRFDLPQWFGAGDRTTLAVVSAIVAVAVTVLAGWIGGRIGSRYHDRADRLIVDTRPGGLTRPTLAEVRGRATTGVSRSERRRAARSAS